MRKFFSTGNAAGVSGISIPKSKHICQAQGGARSCRSRSLRQPWVPAGAFLFWVSKDFNSKSEERRSHLAFTHLCPAEKWDMRPLHPHQTPVVLVDLTDPLIQGGIPISIWLFPPSTMPGRCCRNSGCEGAILPFHTHRSHAQMAKTKSKSSWGTKTPQIAGIFTVGIFCPTATRTREQQNH